MNYTPEGLRRVAGAPLQGGEYWDSEWVIAQLRAHAEALETIAKLESLVYVPGAWSCAKCGLRLHASTLHTQTGAVTADNGPQQCANGCGPMWRITERQAGNDLCDQLSEALEKLAKLKAHAEAMAVAIEHSQGYVNAAKAYRRHFPRDEK